MAAKEEKWIRIFDIPDVSTHRKGFTIYKIISMLYPERCPDAVTKVTVWKRYNDIKKLHRQMKSLHHVLKLPDKFPSLPSSSFFKRFNEEIIQNRRQLILNILEFIANHSQLFTSNDFVKFFETSHTPCSNAASTINSIRAELNLPSEPEEYLSFNSPESDEDCTVSDDTDSLSTMSGVSVQSPVSNTGDSATNSYLNLIEEFEIIEYPDRSATDDYFIDAGKHLLTAAQCEAEKRYEDAFNFYKNGIEILIQHGKLDKDEERRRQAKFKTEKYLLRAEKIYNLYLHPDAILINSNKFHEDILETHPQMKAAFYELYKYKLIRVINDGMLVIHSESQKIFYMKVIQKTYAFLDENLVLPTGVPYMIQLNTYYNCENALFLVLEYIPNLKTVLEKINNIDDVPKPQNSINDIEFEVDNDTDYDSEGSYSDLLVEFNANRMLLKREGTTGKTDVENPPEQDTADYIVVDKDLPIKKEQTDDCIVKWAAQLLIAIENLHKHDVIGCDIRMNNLLVDDCNNLVLSYKCRLGEKYRLIINDYSLAPEIRKMKEPTEAADWWSYGIVLYELMTGLNITAMHPDGILSYTRIKVPKYVSAQARSLITQLLIFEPSKRLGSGLNGSEDIKSHPFFKDIKWNTFLNPPCST